MRVAVWYSNSDVRLEERPRPEPGPGELLLRIEASGICGSDLMEWYRAPRAPLVLGHEVAGVVAALGAGVESFAVGERVVATHHVPCNTCRYCLTDRHSACDTLHATRFEPGGFAEYVKLSPLHVDRGVFRLPPAVSFEAGTFVEPLACAVRAQRLAGVSPGDHVAVLGAGVSGILQLQLARALGAARVYATDTSDYRLAVAASFRADLALRADTTAIARIRDANGGRGVERVLVCTAALAAFEQALELVDRGGTVLFFAPLDPGVKLALDANDLWKRGVNLVHSYAGPPRDMAVALDLIAAGRVDVTSMVTHRLPLSRIQDGFTLAADPAAGLKVLILPGADAVAPPGGR